MTRPWTGNEGAGSQNFSTAEAKSVITGLQSHVGRPRATSLEVFCRKVGLPARTVRAVLSAYDGVEFVLYQQGDGEMFVAEYQDEAERTTRQHLSRANKLLARARRRDAYASRLPRRQGFLFNATDDNDEDDD